MRQALEIPAAAGLLRWEVPGMDFWFPALNRYLWTCQPVPWLLGSRHAASGGAVPTRRTAWAHAAPRTRALARQLTQSGRGLTRAAGQPPPQGPESPAFAC